MHWDLASSEKNKAGTIIKPSGQVTQIGLERAIGCRNILQSMLTERPGERGIDLPSEERNPRPTLHGAKAQGQATRNRVRTVTPRRLPRKREIHRTKGVRWRGDPHSADSVRNNRMERLSPEISRQAIAKVCASDDRARKMLGCAGQPQPKQHEYRPVLLRVN
jgi:hypothetical protein